MKMHTDLTLERWSQFTLFEQLANVGTDVERAIRWRNKGNVEYSNNAFYRALELLDLTLADPKNKRRGCLKELLYVREGLVDYFFENEFNSTDQQWYDYFYHFNYAAALARGK